MSETPTAPEPAADLEVAPEGRKPSKPSAGSAHVAVVSVSYIPTGEKKERRFDPGAHLVKCPVKVLEEYLERGDVVPEADYGDPDACARAEANTPPAEVTRHVAPDGSIPDGEIDPNLQSEDEPAADDEGSEPA